MSDNSELKAFLVRTPFFGGLNDAALERVVAMLRAATHGPGAAVFREGESGRSMYVVESGELLARQHGGLGHDIKLMRFGPSDFFGETTLIEMQPRPFTVLVEKEARLHELTNMDLYQLYQKDVKTYVLVLQNINRELCRRLRRASDRVTQFADEGGSEVTQLGMKPIVPK